MTRSPPANSPPRERRYPRSPYSARDALLSRGELAFYRVLRRATGHSISLKTRLADVVHCPPALWDTAHGRRVSQKQLDFVLYDSDTTAIVVVIELDDRSHAQPDRMRRDAFVNRTLARVGVPLLRIQAASRYSAESLTAQIRAALARPPIRRSTFRRRT